MSLTTGQILDNKYRIVRLIGEGGMGSVHEGENTLIARRVAIKVLHANASANEQALLRFEREAQAAGRIGSDHILEVLDLGTLASGDRYMVMEYLDGEPLSQRIERKGKLTPSELVPLIRQTLKGLQAAHNAGIIHRDLKPDNIFILHEKAGQRDYVKIIDFGISKFSALGSDMNMTRTGAVMGTPYYMSPEQAKGSNQVDPRSDVYAIGVIMYEAVTGKVPFDGNTFNELMFKIVLSEPPKLSEAAPELDPNFAAIINKAMARELDERYATAQQLVQALDEYATKGYAGATAPAAKAEPSSDTGATWANTGTDFAVPKKSSAPLVALAVAGGLLVVGGGAFAAFSWMRGSEAAQAQPSASSGDAAPQAGEQSGKTRAGEGSVAPKPVPEPSAPVVAPAPSPAAVTTASVAVTPEPAAARAERPTTKRVAQPRARPVAAPPAAEPKPKVKKPASPTDFGY